MYYCTYYKKECVKNLCSDSVYFWKQCMNLEHKVTEQQKEIYKQLNKDANMENYVCIDGKKYELSEETLENIKQDIEKQLINLPQKNKDIAESSLKNYSAIIIVENLRQGIDFANESAPEHLEVQVKDFKDLGKIKIY